jgi:NAD(P)-dependent dehydrogenase (short-subunit alcohol dehydrogenase family)
VLLARYSEAGGSDGRAPLPARCGTCATMEATLAVLGYSTAGASFAWATGGHAEIGAALGFACACFVSWLRLPPAVKVPSAGGAVVISGASSGIGRAAAEELAALGFTVFAGVRKAADGEPLKAAGCQPIILDVTSETSIVAAAAQVKKELGERNQPLVAVVNNAGVSGSGLPLELETEENLQFVFGANVFGIIRMNQAFLPLLRDSNPGGGGRIVNIGSVLGHLQTPLSGTYCMTKHAVEALSGCSRAELARFGISVSVLRPGYVRTGIASKSSEHAATQLAKLRAQYPEAQQALYPHVFDAAIQSKLRASSLKKFEICPPPSTSTTPAIVHAITSARPKLEYPVACLQPNSSFPSAALGLWVLSWVPSASKIGYFANMDPGARAMKKNSKSKKET